VRALIPEKFIPDLFLKRKQQEQKKAITSLCTITPPIEKLKMKYQFIDSDV
jgi:hypothetical protein